MRSNSSTPGVMLASSRVHNPWLGADVLRPTRGSKPRARDVSIAKVEMVRPPTTMTGLTFGVPRNKTKKKKKDARERKLQAMAQRSTTSLRVYHMTPKSLPGHIGIGSSKMQDCAGMAGWAMTQMMAQNFFTDNLCLIFFGSNLELLGGCPWDHDCFWILFLS